MRVLILACFLAGCSTVQIPKTVDIPVPVPCIKPQQLQALNTYHFHSDKALLSSSDYVNTLRLWQDHVARKAYIHELEALLSACGGVK